MGIEKEVLIAKLLEDKHITFKEALILMDQKSNQNINYNSYNARNESTSFKGYNADNTFC